MTGRSLRHIPVVMIAPDRYRAADLHTNIVTRTQGTGDSGLPLRPLAQSDRLARESIVPGARKVLISNRMIARSLLHPILEDDNLTRGLGDAEARMLVEWLVDRSETAERADPDALRQDIQKWCRRARAMSRFVHLWCYQKDHGGACQLAATERFPWPLPVCDIDPCDLMGEMLGWEREAA